MSQCLQSAAFLSPDESMTLPGSFQSALLCSSKWALQCTQTLVWGFSVKPDWCTVLSACCLQANSLQTSRGLIGGACACVHTKKLPWWKYAEYLTSSTWSAIATCHPQEKIKVASQPQHCLCISKGKGKGPHPLISPSKDDWHYRH